MSTEKIACPDASNPAQESHAVAHKRLLDFPLRRVLPEEYEERQD